MFGQKESGPCSKLSTMFLQGATRKAQRENSPKYNFQKIKNRYGVHQEIFLWSYNVPKDDYKPTLGSNMVIHVDQNFDLKN